jgi:hypothetical protein
MSEQTLEPTNLNPDSLTSILDEDLSGVDTSIPLLKEGIYNLEIAEVKQQSTSDNAGQMLKIKFKTTEDSPSVTGDIVHAGFPVYHNILTTPKGDMTADMVRKNLAGFAQALGVPRLTPLESLNGRVLKAKLRVRKERTDEKTGKTYAASNEIATFVK